MPQGSVLESDGPEAQGTLGQVQSSDGKIYLFHNTAALKVNDPVMFDLNPRNVTIDIPKNAITQVLGVATLPEGYDDLDANGKWIDPKLNQRWSDDWDKVSERQLRNTYLTRDQVVNYKRYKQ